MFILGFILLFISSSVVALPINCQSNMTSADKATLQAVYQIQVKAHVKKQTLIYWRMPRQVAYQYLESGITEQWTLAANQQMTLIRGYDRDQRAISYDSVDIKPKNLSWLVKSNLVTPSLLKHVKQKPLASVNGCQLVQYQGRIGTDQIQLIWNPQLHLVVDLIANKPKIGAVHYQLQSYQLLRETPLHFQQLAHYETMDFADIGDNEADPFIRKMIHIGFLEHHETGIYDANGHAQHH